MFNTPLAPTPVEMEAPARLVPKVIDTPTDTERIGNRPAVKLVPETMFPTLPTMSAAAEAVKTTLPAPDEVTPVKAY